MARVAMEMLKYEQATAEFLSEMEHTGSELTTVNNYAMVLSMFWTHMLNEGYSQKGPCYTAVQSWRNDMIADGKKPSTIRQYMKILQIFFSWATDPSRGDERYYEINPVTKLLIPDTRKQDKRPYDELLTDEQVKMLYVDTPPHIRGIKPKNWPRNYAIVILALTTELRNSEILDIKPIDINWKNNELTVQHGKGDKFRIVDLPDLAQSALCLYLQSGIRPDGLSDNDYLFGTTGNPVDGGKVVWKRGTRQWLTTLIERHVKAVTGVKNIRSHDLRHVGARLDLNSGMSITELQAKLGHESPNTTQVYSGKLLPRRFQSSAEDVLKEQKKHATLNWLKANQVCM